MIRKILFLGIIIQILFAYLVFAQERGVAVPVKQTNGQKQEEILYRNSYALLIGNSEYAEWNSLPGVERDIPQVEAVLRDKHGFTVEKALNLSKKELLNRIDEFISNYGQDYENRLLIYYAGHGYTAVLPDKRVMGYLVMKDAPVVPSVEESLQKTPKNFSEFRLRAISMDDIENSSKAITTRHALFVFDSCFSGTALYRDNSIAVPSEISTEELEQMRGFLTAGNEKQRVRDNSPFRRAFIKGLEGKADTNGDGFILSSELGAFVKKEVYAETRNTATPQSPIFGKQTNFTRGDMVFVTPNSGEKENGLRIWLQFKDKIGFIKDFESTQAFSETDKIIKIEKKTNGVNKCGYYNSSSKIIVSPKFDFCGVFSEGLAQVGLLIGLKGPKMRYGYINEDGKTVIPLTYEYSYEFSEGKAAVVINNKFGFINKQGQFLLTPKFDFLFVDESEDENEGESLFFPSLDSSKFVNGLAPFLKVIEGNPKFGFITSNGEVRISTIYDRVDNFSENLARVGIKYTGKPINYRIIANGGNLFGFIDEKGKEIIPVRYEFAESFSEGLAVACIDGKCGFIDQKGVEVIPLKYEWVYSFKNGLAPVKNNEKYGFVNKNGEEIILPRFDGISHFALGVAFVEVNNKIGFINKTGREIVPIKYDSVWFAGFIKDGLFGVTLNGKKGFVDIYGNEYFDF